jgi:cytochrome c-type biogenesis protein CcmF
LLITSFYSGQEGSILLWALMMVLIGFFLQPYAKKYGYQELVMGLYSLILVFLTLMLIPRARFSISGKHLPIAEPCWVHSTERSRTKPILQNYWNAIHPPIVFAGYAMMSVPFVFAVAD